MCCYYTKAVCSSTRIALELLGQSAFYEAADITLERKQEVYIMKNAVWGQR